MVRRLVPVLVLATFALLAGPALAANDPGPPLPETPFDAAEDDPGAVGAQLPDLSADGSTIFFTLHGDLWRVPAEGGDATRLTLHEANDIKPRVAPGGDRVAFSSLREGSYDVHLVSAEGGRPTRVTFDGAQDLVADWSPDGEHLLFYSNRNGSYDLYEVAASGGEPRRITHHGAIHGNYSPDGERIVFVRGAVSLNIREYRGSSNWDLHSIPTEGGVPRRLTDTEWNERDPFWSSDGESILYAAEDTDHYNLWRIPAEGGEAEKVADLDGDIRWVRVGAGGRKVVFQRHFSLHVLDLESGEERPVEASTRSDDRGYTTRQRSLTSGAEHPAWSPDGQRIAFSLRGDIWTMAASGGPARRVTNGPGTDRWPRWSPDGERIAFFSNRSGNQDLWVVGAGGGSPEQVTSHPADDFYHSWGPDSRRIIFCSERSGNRDIWEVDLEGGSPRQLTDHEGPDDDPRYSPDGEWIAWDSNRSGNQDIWIMRPDGSDARQVTRHPAQDQVPDWSPDGSMICFDAFRDGERAAWVVEVGSGREMMLTAGGSLPDWSPDGDTIIFEANRDGYQGVHRVAAPAEVLAGEPIRFIAEETVDLREEFVEVFDGAWNALRQGFYDPSFHGVDWEAMRERYRPLVERCETREELYDIIRSMLGELKASHMGIRGPRPENRPRARTGYLGLELTGPGEGPGMTVASVVPGGPADDAWVRPGDRVFAVAGTDISPDEPVARLLDGRVRQEVSVVVGPTADRSEARSVDVRTASWGDLRRIRYEHWVETRRTRVEEASDGRLCYVHLDAMNQENLRRFRRAVARHEDREGMVLDVRNNGGGNIHQDLIDILAREPYVYFDPRSGDRRLQQSPAWAKPVVLLINERSFSDAEIFPYGFQRLDLGQVVGTPTAGGVIGTGSVTLADGSRLRMPSTGWFGMAGENLEGFGVEPDVVVEITPEDRVAGRDPQLRRAIEIVLGEVEAADDDAEGEEDGEEQEPEVMEGEQY